MRQATAAVGDGGGRHERVGGGVIGRIAGGPEIAGGIARVGRRRTANCLMRVRGQLRNEQRVAGFTTRLAKDKAISRMDGKATLQVGQGEGGGSIATVRGAQQREQGLILVDEHELPVALRPAFGREVERENPDFRKIRGAHKNYVCEG